MASKQSTETMSDAREENLIRWYGMRLRKIESIKFKDENIFRIKDLCIDLESEIKKEMEPDSKKREYLIRIHHAKNNVKIDYSLYVLLDELKELNAPICKSQESSFERQISTAREELEKVKSDKTIDYFFKQELIRKSKQNSNA